MSVQVSKVQEVGNLSLVVQNKEHMRLVLAEMRPAQWVTLHNI